MLILALALPGIKAAIAAGEPGRNSDFEALKSSKITKCQTIPDHKYSTGLLFNPAGYQTFFHRSECFQKLAVAERDQDLCDRVRERDSWFFDGWFISPRNCRKLVEKRRKQDDREFAELDLQTIARLTDLTVRRNGNGRDFDLLVTTEGTFSGLYLLEIFLEKSGGKPALLYRERVQSGLLTGTRYLLLRNTTLTEALAGRPRHAPYTLRATLLLMPTESNRFYYHRLPADRLASDRSISVDFADLPPWQPEQLPND